MKRLICIALLVSIFTAHLAASEKKRVLHYDPEVVTLEGVIVTKTFAGPPNYESITQGDVREDVALLKLDKPFDVVVTPHDDDPTADSEANVKIVHIAHSNSAYEKFFRDGYRVRIIGKLYHRTNGHQRTRVLIDLIKISLLSKQ